MVRTLLLFLLLSLVAASERLHKKRRDLRRKKFSKKSGRRGFFTRFRPQTRFVRGQCMDGRIATVGNSCGVPDFVDANVFGDNLNTVGSLRATTSSDGGMSVSIRLDNLPRPDLVMTAWIIWVPGGVTEPPIFEVANHAVPVAPTTAGWTTGFARDANQLYYTGYASAQLNANLNFNPMIPGQGPLTRETFCFQRDVTGIQDTSLQHYPTPDGVFIPTSSSYLRQYDPATGFEMLDANGDPVVARSPVRTLGIEVVAHVDKTTHGLSQGVAGVDHYLVMFFPLGDE